LDLVGREALVATLSEICCDPFAPVTIMVTHHVEEIPTGITHALLLADGQITAAGPIETTLTSETLSDTFGIDLSVISDQGRWAARAVLPKHARPGLGSFMIGKAEL
ncbi:MAG: hypothetical protein FWG47_08395, partial [Propionibacteriaceae bacterium]|nr:hypothetical protein [Propionibacteriaceae bacterium]